jgi:hypothetical protein
MPRGPQVYCCVKCRRRDEYLKIRAKVVIEPIICKYCGGIYPRKDLRTKDFCSSKCRYDYFKIERNRGNYEKRRRRYLRSSTRKAVALDMIKELGLEDQLNLRVRAIMEVLEEEGNA